MLLDDIHPLQNPTNELEQSYAISAVNTPRFIEKPPFHPEKPPSLHPITLCIVSNRDTLKQLVYDVSQFDKNPATDKNLICPLVFDTEYTQPVIKEFFNESEHIPPRLNLTVQVKHPLYGGEIFLHPDLEKPLPSYTPLTPDNLPDWGFFEDLAFIDYLKRLGLEIELTNEYPANEKDKRPVFIFKIYAHFLIADISTTGGEWWHGVVRDLYINERLTMERRATIQSGDFKPPYFTLPTDINLNVQGVDYKMGIQIIDTIALQGNVSLAEMASNVGVKMESKNELDDLKTRMDIALLERTDIFKAYALGDLVIYEILQKWYEQVRTVYQSLDVLEHFKQPALTMGATVAGVFEARLRRLLSCPKPQNPKDDRFYELLGCDCTSEHLAGLTSGDFAGLHLLSKVGGGRAFNNAPKTANLNEPCIDMDLAGAYSSAMQNQPFPVGGLPVLMNFKRDKQPTLREFLKRWQGELINGLWLAVISTPENFTLSTGQDYFRTWTPAKLNQGRINPKHGETKYYSHEFYNSQFTSHDLSYLEDLTPRLKNEILDNVIINSAIVYPKSLVLTDINQLNNEDINKVFKWTIKKNVYNFKGRGFYQSSMGDLVINELQAWRDIYPKKGTVEDKLKNTLFKLFVNTTYGIAVSPFFKTANVVVGNNITAAVRRGAWCLEKGCNGQQSITDGGIFPLNQVLDHRLERQNFSPSTLYKTYEKTPAELNRLQATLKPLLGGHTEFKMTEQGLKTVVDGVGRDFSAQEINEKTLSHLQKLFPNEPLFNQNTPDMVVTKSDNGTPVIKWQERKGILKFEMKTPVIRTSLHGTANYQLFTHDNKSVLKMRSYTGKQHYGFELVNNELTYTDVYKKQTVSEFFHYELLNNPHDMRLPPPYMIEKILKPKDYAKNPDKWTDNVDLDKSFPSWNVLKVGLLRPCTLSQFQFRTAEQWDKWYRAGEKLKRRYGYSFEVFFIKDNGRLDYQLMIEKLDTLIGSGDITPVKTLTAYWKKSIPEIENFKVWNLLRDKVKQYQEMDLSESIEDDLDFDSEYERIMNGGLYD